MYTRYPENSWINPKIEILPSSIHGQGMFAKAQINAGDIVVVWGGISGTKEEAERATEQGKLVIRLDDDLYTIEGRRDDDTYFMNHSCDPNVWMKDACTLVARRNISAGEELTLDYALVEGDETFFPDWECVCGSSQCRKKITGRDWLLPELQQRYGGHFSPLINRRISQLKEDG